MRPSELVNTMLGMRYNVKRPKIHFQPYECISTISNYTVAPRSKSILSCDWLDLEDALGDAFAVSQHLAKYTLNAALATANQTEFGIATNEGSVQALQLQATAIILKTNECIVAPPQVYGTRPKNTKQIFVL